MNKILKNLVRIVQILKRYEIKYWLNYGTLLSIYKNEELLDNDVDLATLDLDKIRRIKRIFEDEGYKFSSSHNSIALKKNDLTFGIHDYQEDKHVIKNVTSTLYTDRFFAKKFFYLIRKTKRRYSVFYPFFRLLGGFGVVYLIPKKYVLPLKELNYKGCKFNVPKNTEKYLEYFYGTTWILTLTEEDFPKFVERNNFEKFKGRWNSSVVVCPKCKKMRIIRLPHKLSGNENKIFIKTKTKCSCGNVFKDNIFIKGTVQRRLFSSV